MASDRLVVSGPLPPSSNTLYPTGRNGRRYLTKEGKEYKKNLQKAMMEQGARKKCPEPPFSWHLHLRMPDRRRRDTTNFSKLIEDSVFSYLGYDDSLVHDSHQWKYIDREKPGMTLELRHCDRKLEEAS